LIVGKYLSTKIYEFSMKCHLCGNLLIIQTDPKGCDYKLVTGCEKKQEEWDTSKTGNLEYKPEETAKLQQDAFYKLENTVIDQNKGEEELPRLQRIIEYKNAEKDDYDLNARLRKEMRMKRKKIEEKEKNKHEKPIYFDELKEMKNTKEDLEKIKQIKFNDGVDKYRLNRYNKREIIRNESIFSEAKSEKAAKNEELRMKISKLPKITQKLIMKDQKKDDNFLETTRKLRFF